jgi:hypothetical protein
MVADQCISLQNVKDGPAILLTKREIGNMSRTLTALKQRAAATLLAVGTGILASGANAIPFDSIDLRVDTAPNVYGSPAWAPWWASAKSDVAAGSFTDMRSSSAGPGYMTPYDEIAYSTGDLGQRMHFIYWLPETTIGALEGRFQVKNAFDWGGTDYTYDWGSSSYAPDSSGAGWIQPGSWENYQNGVIGSFGWAFWATDNEAAPFSTGGSAYDETDQADIDALANSILGAQTYLDGLIRYRETENDDWSTLSQTLQITTVPVPATFGLMGIGLAGILGFTARRRRRVA